MPTSIRRTLRPAAALFALPSLLTVLLAATPVRAQNMQLPQVPLPAAEPSAPALWGTTAAMQARMVAPSATTLAHYDAVKNDLAGVLASPSSIPSLGDDRLAAVAKEAALIHALDEAPPNGNGQTTYRDLATAALGSIGPRTSGSLLNTNPTPPTIDVLEDSPRLQSMAEAYDLLRGSGVAANTDTAIRALIDQWAGALAGDGNLDTLGIYPHKDNWGLKASSALITAALALSSDGNASSWMTFANSLADASIQNVSSSAGWYRESAHYLNYALDDLFSTAVQVQNVTGVDWLTPLKPFAQAALDLRQPDGSEAPFEDGVSCVFPFDVFAPYYPDIGGSMAWAFANSNQDTDSYPNQQPVEATRFLAGELPAAAAPSGRPSRFVGGDAHISSLRSGWDGNAVEATLFAARDYEDESGSIITSYHDMNNPLDLVVAGDGATLLPTSGGGPEVTTSPDRSYYLKPSSKNVPLVNGGAPWITDGTKISSDLQLAGQDELGLTGRYLDLSRATFAGAYTTPSTAVARTIALIGGQYLAVVDEMDVQAGQTATLDIPLHGRGTRSPLPTQIPSPLYLNWAYSFLASDGVTQKTADLDSFTVGSTALTVQATSGTYAASYGATEETIDGAEISAASSATPPFARTITLLDPRDSSASALTVADRTQSGTPLPGLLAVEVTQGDTIDHIATAPTPYVLKNALEIDGGVVESDAGVELTNIDGVSTDAVFSAVREESGALVSFGVGNATTLSFNGAPVLVSGTPVTVSFNESPALDGGSLAAGYIGELSPDMTGNSSFAVHGMAGFDPGVPYSATYQEQPIAAPSFIQLPDGFQFGALASSGTGGTIAIAPNGPEILAPIPAQTVAEGQLLTFTLPATAPAGTTLTFGYTSTTTFQAGTAPVLDSTTGVFTWTPDYNIANASGPADVVINFVATTGPLTVTRACHITVTDVDRGPILQPIPNAIVRRESNYSLQLQATDPDGYPITYSYQPLHAFPSPAPSFDTVHGTFSWNCPLSAPLGTNVLTFTASDGHVSASQMMNLVVQDVNHPPVFVSINGVPLVSPTVDSMQASVGKPLTLVIEAHDPDGDPITYTARQARGNLPDGATFVPTTQTFTWTPDATGSTTIIVTAADDYGGTAELQLTINVTGSSGCTSGGAPGAFAMLLGLLLVLRSRRKPRALDFV